MAMFRMVFYRFTVRKIIVAERDSQKWNAQLCSRLAVKKHQKEGSAIRDASPMAVSP